MTWREKLERLKALLDTKEDLVQMFECVEAAPPAFLNELAGDYPWLPPEYLQFLRFSDGAQLGTFVLAGSGRSPFPGVPDLAKRWGSVMDMRANVAIGEDAGGAAFLVSTEGAVSILGTDPPSVRQAVAPSFESFLDDVLVGPRYESLFPQGTYPGDMWLELLRDEGWA